MKALEIYDELRKKNKLEKSMIMKMIKSDDIEVKGLIYDILTREEYGKYIVPTLSQEEFTVFFRDHIISYLFECVETNPDGDFSDSRYTAATDIAKWIKYYYLNQRDIETVNILINELENLYLSGSVDVRTCLECGVIEHVFEIKDIQPLFDRWKLNPVLSDVYRQAKKWADTQDAEDTVTED